MRIVFDLDDTICRTQKRDYVNSTEISAVVSKIHELRETLPGVQIVVHTSRGMASCEGNVNAAEAKNRPTVEKWLKDHGIEVDEIIFGKPLADLYVDDKAMTAADFGRAKIRRYYGFSGATVTRIGKVMIKEATNVDEQLHWYQEAKKHYAKLEERYPLSVQPFRVPTAYSATLGKLYLQFVPGVVAAKVASEVMMHELIDVLILEPELGGVNDLDGYARYVESRAESVGVKTDIGTRIRLSKPLLRRTFYHGDFSLQNILCNSQGYTLIDPSPKQGISTWILDAGKLRASVLCLDEVLANTPHPYGLLNEIDNYIRAHEQDGTLEPGTGDAVRLACESHILRVWYYAKKLGKRKQEKQLARYYRDFYE